MKTTPRLMCLGLTLVVAFAAAACDDTYTNEGYVPEVEEVIFDPFPGAGIGKDCDSEDDCRDGLVCEGAAGCLPSGDKQINEKCLLTEECDGEFNSLAPNGLHCGWAGFCVPSGAGEEGATCSTSSECERLMFCDMQGLSGYCSWPEPGTGRGDLDSPCDSTYECLAGLRCAPPGEDEDTGMCVPGSLLLYPDLFTGAACYETAEVDMDFGVRMAIPGSEAHTDYFAFPHPTDARTNDDGTVDLSDFPVPGEGLIGFDPIGATADALDGEVTGWSLLSGIYFRFSKPVDETTVITGQSVRLINLQTGELHPIVASFEPMRNKFSCGNRLFLQPILARPLDKSTTYAAVVTTAVSGTGSCVGPAEPHCTGFVAEFLTRESCEGAGHTWSPAASSYADQASCATAGFVYESVAATQIEAMPMLLSGTAPSDEDEKKAWDSYAPLRTYLGTTTTLSAEEVAGATVFTTGDPTAVVGEIYDLVHEENSPSIVWGPVACIPGADGKMPASRCGTPSFDATPDPETGLVPTDPRACPTAAAASYTEYHTMVRVPVIQRGARPYINDDSDEQSGDLSYVGGKLVPFETEDICVAFSVPTGVEPAEGWPVLLYGHGTGGNHRPYGILAEELGRAGNGNEFKDRFIVMAWDQPMHHLRRFPKDAVVDLNADLYQLNDNNLGEDGINYVVEYAKEPGPLFYNFQNPRAARANYLQAVSDTFSLVRLLEEWAFNLPDLDGGQCLVDGGTRECGPLKIDENRLAYHGHSQGGGNGPMVAPFESGLGLMVLSGTGGSTVDGILGKTMPYDSSIGCRIMLQEIDVTRTHPGMHILQHYFDSIDPGIYGPLLDDPPATKTHPDGAPQMNFMQVVGVADSFTPPVSMAAYSGSTNSDLLIPLNGVLPAWADDMTDDLVNYTRAEESQCSDAVVMAYVAMGLPAPKCVGPNRPANNPTHTRVSIQHPPCDLDSDCPGALPNTTSFDGHFVVYKNEDALAEIMSFVYSWARTGTAQVLPAGSNTL